MAKKYRVKLKTDRIVGPFSVDQIAELFLKGHLTGDESFQDFPAGSWTKLKNLSELSHNLKKILTDSDQPQTSEHDNTKAFVSISELKNQKEKLKKEKNLKNIKSLEENANKAEFKEFKFKKDVEINVDYNELEKKYEEETESEADDEALDGVEKTKIIKLKLPEKVEKTLIVNPEVLEELKKENSEEEKTIPEDENEVTEESEEEIEEELDVNEKTGFININSVLAEIKDEANELERDLKNLAQTEQPVKIQKKKKKKKVELVNDKKRKPLRPIVAFAFAALLYFLIFPDDGEKKTIKPLYLKISAPTTREFINEQKSKDLYQKGLKFLVHGTYFSKLKAANSFKQSLEYKFDNNPALGELIYAYSHMFQNVKEKKKGASTLFKLIEISRSKILKDSRVALGSALFYARSKKYYTSIQTIENYIRLNKPTIDLFCTYLGVLTEAGELDRAKRLKDKIEKFKKVPPDCYLNLARFYEYDENFNEAHKMITKGLKFYPASVALLLENVGYSLKNENWKRYEEILKKIQNLKAEQSPVYYSKFLEYMGILSAKKGDNKTAVKLFKVALGINESQELRSRLAALELGGTYSVENLILESKIIDLMRKARKNVKARDWEKAFTFAIEAADLNESYIPAQLLLADIQVKRGFFESAIKTLRNLKKEFPLNPEINFSLINAYIHSLKLTEAHSEINLLSSSKIYTTPEYASLLARYYLKSGKVLLTIQWFQESINRNPLNDEDYYLLAKTFLKHRRYKKAKNLLVKAVSLDPLNENYHSLYASILYELEGSEVAIGYLRDQLKSNPNAARILGDIAIYYYKEGQTKEFDLYKQKIENLTNKDTNFYQFLIESAQLEENFQKVIDNGRELIKVDPGNIGARMILGEYLLKIKKYDEALEVFKSITNRLESYPKVYYFIAKVYVEMKDYKKALEAAEREIKNNPSLYYGYYITGETYRLMGEYPKSINNLERAISIDGKSVEALMSLGWIKMKQNYLDVARELYNRALKYDESNPEIRKQLGFIYRGIGQGILAAEELSTYLKLSPAAPDRRKIEALIRQLRR